MKRRILSIALLAAMCAALLAGCGQKSATWKVTCPWAPSGVAAMVSQQAATKSTSYSDTITLVAEAIKGDAATVNTWVADTKANDTELVFVGEGLLSITSILDPAKMQFGYEDFVFVENLYSSIFVLSADAKLNIGSVADLEAYVQQGTEISVAVNGATSSEAFLAASLFGVMARAGTDEKKVAELKELYGKILADTEVVEWLQGTMLLEVDTMSVADVEAHVENVKSIVNEYKDIVAG